MREFLLNHAVPISAVAAAAEFIITVILLADARHKRSLPVLLMAAISAGLTYDAAILAGGNVLPAEWLPLLSRFRFIAHGLLLPLCIVLSCYALDWVNTKKLLAGWIITGMLCVTGAVSGAVRGLEFREFAGMLRYVSDGSPAWAERFNRMMNFGTVLPMMAAGIIVWKRQKNPCFFFAGFLMLLFSALGPITGNADLIFLISMFGELCMVGGFMLYEKSVWRGDKG